MLHQTGSENEKHLKFTVHRSPLASKSPIKTADKEEENEKMLISIYGIFLRFSCSLHFYTLISSALIYPIINKDMFVIFLAPKWDF